jgi:outer membrane protein OmpA-like peptidoglycan-associated protein
MTSRFFSATILFCLFSLCLAAQSPDSLIYAEGKVINADTKELISARITYQSLPYGNKVGVINSNTYSFPMFDGEKYSIMVEAAGFAPAKYMLDPAEANAEKKVVKDIELSNGAAPKPSTHVVGHVMRLNNLIFEVGNSKIDPESYPELDLVVNMMKENPAMVIQLEGHTDYVGAASDNMKLSQRRVESVKSYVASKGIQKSRMKTKAFGGTQPISRDNTPEAHRLNRRVEVRILQN